MTRPVDRQLSRFGRSWNQRDLHLFFAKHGVVAVRRTSQRLLFGPNPDGTGTADDRKQIVAKQLRGALQVQLLIVKAVPRQFNVGMRNDDALKSRVVKILFVPALNIRVAVTPVAVHRQDQPAARRPSGLAGGINECTARYRGPSDDCSRGPY